MVTTIWYPMTVENIKGKGFGRKQSVLIEVPYCNLPGVTKVNH
jgi:hypothetical protein